jgi:hypothetical protein
VQGGSLTRWHESPAREEGCGAPRGGEENAWPRGQARRWASPCSNSPRAARTRAVELDETCGGVCSDEGALRNCARRGPRRPCPRVTRYLSWTRPPRQPLKPVRRATGAQLASGGTESTRCHRVPRSVAELRHEPRTALEPRAPRAGLLCLGVGFGAVMPMAAPRAPARRPSACPRRWRAPCGCSSTQ